MGLRESILSILQRGNVLTSHDLTDALKPSHADRATFNKRILYHLKKLEENSDITLIERRKHGLKAYRMRERDDDPPLIRTAYEESGLFVRANETRWGHCVDAITIDATETDETTIERALRNDRITDAIGIIDPDPLSNELLELIARRRVPITISLNAEKLERWTDKLDRLIQCGATLISRLKAQQISTLSLRPAIHSIIEHEQDWYVQNIEAHRSPIIIGKLGPHTYETYPNEPVSVCTQNTYCIDVNRFLRYHPISELREALLTSMEMIGQTNITLRSRIEEIFSTPISLSQARTYVRFWNYGLKEPGIDQETVLLLLKSTKEVLERFTMSQETIYTSCGMPTTFRLGFAPLFSSAAPAGFSTKRFPKLEILSSRSLEDPHIRKMLEDREHTSALFSGGDRVRIHRRPANPNEILREMSYIHKTYAIPLVCYSFSSRTRTLLDY